MGCGWVGAACVQVRATLLPPCLSGGLTKAFVFLARPGHGGHRDVEM